jgi:hypothetical protein
VLLLMMLLCGCPEKPQPPPPAPSPSRAQVTCHEVAGCIQKCPPATLADCTNTCKAPLSTAARPLYDALEACSKPACASSCGDPTAIGCKLCVMSHCASQVSACMSN